MAAPVNDDFQGVPDDMVIVVGKVHAEVMRPVWDPGPGRGEPSSADVGVKDPYCNQQQPSGDKPRTDLPFAGFLPLLGTFFPFFRG